MSLISTMYESTNLDVNKLEDVLAFYFARNHKEWVSIKDDEIKINSDFDASYSWEIVMTAAFAAMAEHLDEKSELYIHPDYDYDLLVIENGKVVYKH